MRLAFGQIGKGRSVQDIVATFALTELQMRRISALGELLLRIREAYRSGDQCGKRQSSDLGVQHRGCNP